MYLCLIEQNSKIGPCVKLQKQGTFIFRRYVNIEEQSNYEPGIGCTSGFVPQELVGQVILKYHMMRKPNNGK